MVYLFTQDGETCTLFDGNKEVYISNNKITMTNHGSYMTSTLAKYNSKEECEKAMKLFYKRLNLGATVFQFPKEI